jgi:hypothetical protein
MHVKVGVADGDFVGDTHIAIQLAVDAVGSYGGGTVELKPGAYTLSNSIRLHRNVRLVGAGPDTVLRPCPPARSALLVDADYGQKKVTLEDPSGFAYGMGVVVADDHVWGYAASVAAITVIQGNTAYLDRRIAADCCVERGAEIWNAFSLIAAVDVDSVTVEGLTLDGAGGERAPVNGCVGGGIYLYQARRCRIADCIITGFAGDGISYQTTQDVLVERCEVTHSAALGIHPGTGSVHTIVRNCRAHHNGEDGLYLCFRVQEGLFEDNDFSDNGRYGISIGHKDTGNIFTGNRICRNRSHGVCFRDETPTNAGSRNVFRRSTIEDNGECGVHIGGHTTDVLFEQNAIRDTRRGDDRTQRIGICAGEQAGNIRARENHIENNLEAAVRGTVRCEG